MTSKYRKCYWISLIISMLLNFGPLIGYTCSAFCAGTAVIQKFALGATLLIVCIMTLICMLNKIVLKSRLWIFLIGLYLCLNNILTPLLIIAVCQVVDELLVHPFVVSSREKLVIHKEFDKR